MECFEVDTKLISYLEHSLNDEELEEFLEHLQNCEECRQEVEMHFTLIEGLQQMDEEEIKIFDFPAEFNKQNEEQYQEIITRKKYRGITDRLVLLFVLVMIFFGFVYGIIHRYDYHTHYIAQEERCYEQQVSID